MENLRTGLDRSGVTDARSTSCSTRSLPIFRSGVERRNQAGGTLSGGEQQMLAIGAHDAWSPRSSCSTTPTEGLMPRMVSQIRHHRRPSHEASRFCWWSRTCR